MQEHSDDSIQLPALRPAPAREVRRNGRSANGEVSPAPQVSPKFLLWVLGKSWRVVVPAGVLLAGVAASVLLYNYVPMFEARALIQIERNQTFVVGDAGVAGNPISTQVEMIRQPFVIREALQDPTVARAEHLSGVKDKVSHIQKSLKTQNVGRSEYYRLVYVAPSPVEAEDVLAAIVFEYADQLKGHQFQRTQNVIKELTNLEAEKKDEVEHLKSEVIDLTTKMTGRDPSRNNRIIDVEKAFATLDSLHSELTSLDVEMEVLQAEINAIKDSDTGLSDPRGKTDVIDMLVARSPEVRALEAEIELLREAVELREEQLVDASSDRDYRNLQEEVDEKLAELETVSAEVRVMMFEQDATSRRLTGEAAINFKQGRFDQLQRRRDAINSRYEAELAKAKTEDTVYIQLHFKEADLEQQMRVLEMISQRKLILQTETRAPARFTLKDPPRAVDAPLESAPWKKLIVACGLAFVAPFGVAVLREVSLKRIVDAEQLYGESHLRVLGEIASFPTRRVAANPQQLPRSLRREMHAFAESIDALRMSLTFHRSPDESPTAFAITSAVSSEGKTSVSSALAMSFANAIRKPTLLIDGDLRDPSVPDLIPLQEGPGLAEVLAGKCAIGEAIQSAESTENLYVLPAGNCQGSPHALVQPRRLRKLLDTLRERFSVIVIDTPPVLGASESLTLCGTADVTSVCVMRGSSRVRQLQIANEKLDAAGANLAGAVLNAVPTHGYGYAYAYGYGFRDREAVGSDV